ncbi:MAG: helix-hairpin-helix domain-containing protein [Chloroflexota bacterium]|nr:helix-hairpin-helix domain-containing protein [Chloroflexota bacterium]
MISRIRGRPVDWHEDRQSVEIDTGSEAGGLVYEVLLPTAVWLALENNRPEVLDLFTHYHVPDRAPVPVLIGFLRPIERDFFRKLIGVPQMGVAKAQQALAASVSTIAQAIEAEDRRTLTQLPGIGTRQADRIIADLKGKVVEEALLVDEGFDARSRRPVRPTDEVADDTAEALVGLGYTRRDADRWIAAILSAPDIPAPESTEDLLRAVLEYVGSSS